MSEIIYASNLTDLELDDEKLSLALYWLTCTHQTRIIDDVIEQDDGDVWVVVSIGRGGKFPYGFEVVIDRKWIISRLQSTSAGSLCFFKDGDIEEIEAPIEELENDIISYIDISMIKDYLLMMRDTM